MSTTNTLTTSDSKKKKKELTNSSTPPPLTLSKGSDKKHKHHHSKHTTTTTTTKEKQPSSSSSSSSSSEDDTILLCTNTPRTFASPRYHHMPSDASSSHHNHNHHHHHSSSSSSSSPAKDSTSSSSSDDSEDYDTWSAYSGNTKRSAGSSSIASIHSYRSAWSSMSGNRMSPRTSVSRPPIGGLLGSPLMSVVQFDAGSDGSGSRTSTGARRDWRKVPSKILGDDEVEKKAILVDFDESVYDVRKMKESEREALEKGKTYALKVNKTVKKFVSLVAKKENIGNPELFELFDPANNVVLNDDMPLYMYYTKEGLASKHRRRFILRVATEDGLITSSSSSSSSSSEYYSDDGDGEYRYEEDDDDDDGRHSSRKHKKQGHKKHHHKHDDDDGDGNGKKHKHKSDKHRKHHHSKHDDSDKRKGKKSKKDGSSSNRGGGADKMDMVRDRRASAPSSQRPIIQTTSTPPVNVSIMATSPSSTPRRQQNASQLQQSQSPIQQQQQLQQFSKANHYNTISSPSNTHLNSPSTKSKSKAISDEDKARKALIPPKLLEPIMPSLIWDEDFEVGRKVYPQDTATTSAAASTAAASTQANSSVSTTIRELLVTLPPRYRTAQLTPTTPQPIPAIVVRNTARASPYGRRVIVWCHDATESLETCYPEIQRATSRHPKLDVLAPEYRGFGIRKKAVGGRYIYNYNNGTVNTSAGNVNTKLQPIPTVPEMLDDLVCALKHASDGWSRPYILYGRGLGAELALFFATKLFFVGGGSKTGGGKSMLDGEAEKAKRSLAVLVMEDPVLSPEFCNAVEFYGDCVECNVVIGVNTKEYSKNVLKRIVSEFKHASLHHKNNASGVSDRDAVIDEALILAAKYENATMPSSSSSSSSISTPSMSPLPSSLSDPSANTNSNDVNNDSLEISESIAKLSQIFGSKSNANDTPRKGAASPAPSTSPGLTPEGPSASMLREWFRRRGYDAWLAETVLRAGPRTLREIAEAHPSQAQMAEFPFLERVIKEAKMSVAVSQVQWKVAKKSMAGGVGMVRSPQNRMKRVEINEPPKSWNILVVIKQTM